VAVYCETDWGFRIDVDDLELKIKSSGAKYLMVSHMRGKIADMDRIAAVCEEHGVYLIEDCAHSIGVLWNGEHTGHHGKIACISSQSYKMLNSGEGGFFLTDDDAMAAEVATYAGAYEGLSVKHLTVPPLEAFAGLSVKLPNYSLRMSALSAAVIRPQVKTLDERAQAYNTRYEKLKSQLLRRLPGLITIPDVTPGVTMPVHDSLQFNLAHSVTDEQTQAFLDECAAHGLPVELFGHKSNARNFINWGFAPAAEPLPKTAKMLSRACDVRLPLLWEDEDFDTMANVIVESLTHVLESPSA
jgi:dTDP-4-amino-4,6-dideoxygalactose transaminase